MKNITMLAGVTGAVAGWSIFSVVTIDVVTKKKIIIADNTNIKTQEVPQFNWYFLKWISCSFKAYDADQAIKIGTDWIDAQTPIYCDERIINFKSYLKLPLFSTNRGSDGDVWIRNPFILKNTKDPKGWYCVTKSITSHQDYYEAQYDLFYHQSNN